MLSLRRFLSPARKKSVPEKRAAQASRIVMEDGFPSYLLTSQRLREVQADYEQLQKRERYLQNLRQHPTTNQKRKEEIEAELDAIAESVKTSVSNTHLKFIVFGCQGNAEEQQKEVARLINELAKDPANKPDFMLILGDNFYDSGVSSPLDQIFKTHFEKIYGDKETAIGKIPCFPILGNHDLNFHKLGYGPKGVEVGMHQVVHSYLGNHTLYQQPVLDLDRLPNWNMPARAYSLRCQDTEIFCIDSSTYAMDFLAAKKGDTSLSNQAIWLQTKVKEAQAAGRKTILALHHPLVTQGKRAFISDLNLYLSQENQAQLKEVLPGFQENFSYNALLNEIISNEQNLGFSAVLSAHDHFQAYYNNAERDSGKFICQVTAGGGGGGTHNRKQFKTHANMGYFSKEHGFTQVTSWLHKRALQFVTYSTDQSPPIVCTNQSPTTLQIYPAHLDQREKQTIQLLHVVLRQALSDYFEFLGKDEPDPLKTCVKEKKVPSRLATSDNLIRFFKHGREGVDRAHKLWGYLNQVMADDYETTLRKTLEILDDKRITTPDENSLITRVNDGLRENFGAELAELVGDSRKEKEVSYH